MSGVMVTKYECMDCGEMFLKSQKKTHTLKYDHIVSSEGRKFLLNTIVPQKLLTQKIVEIEQRPRIKFKRFPILNKFTGDWEKDYPNTASLFALMKLLMN
jgi:hypothetical protein